jgi:glycosyltransferase involved in cell wall biosynthesis
MPVISIIVPVYKVEPYLRECLDSVLAQTFTDYECILVDDGSPDNCPAICDEYAAKHPQMKVIHKENGGLSDARNVGIEAAVGEYIVLLDSDDLFAGNDALQNLFNVIQETKAPVIFNSNLTSFNKNECGVFDGIDHNFISGDPVQFYKQFIKGKGILAGWMFVCLCSFLIEHKLFFKKGILHEDMHWIPRLICAAEKIAVNHSLFYKYRTNRDNSIMSKITPKHLFDRFIIIEELLVLLKNNEKREMIYKNMCSGLWFSIFISCQYIEKEYKTDYKKIAGELKENSYLLLYRKKAKYIFWFLLFSAFGIKFCQYVFKQYRQFKLIFVNHK